MAFKPTRIPYRATNAFSKIVLDYIDQEENLRPFYLHQATVKGIQQAIELRNRFPTKRNVLVSELRKQYETIITHPKVKDNIEKLSLENCYSITTAHQNNLFTGPLYVIYKIVHAIRLADHLNETIKDKQFVPVFYLGSEDADLDELNHIWLNNEKLAWNTNQTGAVGRMVIDEELISLIAKMEGQLGVLAFGNEITGKLREYYQKGKTIAQATFEFLNTLFGEFGLVILEPDNAVLKAEMKELFKDEIINQTASAIVEQTLSRLESAGYRVQANPREINLFYLEKNKRTRIEEKNGEQVGQLLHEIELHPEKFSPNVILRGLYQETILPNIAFIGGGGETAYWLQLRDLFNNYKIPFPVLLLRNSFMIVEDKWRARINKLGFEPGLVFKDEQELLNEIVKKETRNKTGLNGSLESIKEIYDDLKKQAEVIDNSLGRHVDALKEGVMHKLVELEKKMLRAERRKFSDQQRQLSSIKEHLFPNKGLQERRDNLVFYYAKWGSSFIKELYNASLTTEQEFTILEEFPE